MNYLKDKRHILFPGLKDFNRNYKEFKIKSFKDHENFMDWFWFSPWLYNVMTMLPIMFVSIFFIIGMFINIHVVAKLLIIAAYVYYLYTKKKSFEWLDTNLYEMHIKN